MNASFLSFILAGQGRIIKRLIKHKAIDSDSAVLIETVGLRDNLFLRKLILQGMVVRISSGKVYANTEMLSKNLIWRRYLANRI